MFRFGNPRLDSKTVKDIIVHGPPEGIGQLAAPVMTMCMNLVLISKIGDIGVNAFSIISYVSSFAVAVFFATGEGLQPLFGRSYGAGNEKDLKYYFKTGIWINFLGSVAVAGLLPAVGRQVCTLFGANAATLDYVLEVLPLYSWGFVVMSFNVMISAYLYSTDKPLLSTVINALRGVVVSTVVILALPEIFGAGIIRFTLGISEAVVLIVATALLAHSNRADPLPQ